MSGVKKLKRYNDTKRKLKKEKIVHILMLPFNIIGASLWYSLLYVVIKPIGWITSKVKPKPKKRNSDLDHIEIPDWL